ncbi:MAG: hypothetical protein ACREX4_14915 [Gammaproteobacteria bacterium]
MESGNYLPGSRFATSRLLALGRSCGGIRRPRAASRHPGRCRDLGPNTRIGVSQELAGEEGQEVSIEHQLAPRWNIEASTRTKGSSAIDLFWRWPD